MKIGFKRKEKPVEDNFLEETQNEVPQIVLTAQKEASIQKFRCKFCNDVLDVSGISEVIICPHCQKSSELAAVGNLSDEDFISLIKQTHWKNDIYAYKCSACGAVCACFDAPATKCPFCPSKDLSETSLSQFAPPLGLLPFNINKATAIVKCSKWISSMFVPKAFKKSLDVENIQGVFFPVWVFGGTLLANYNATLGNYAMQTIQLGKKLTREEHINWFNAEGNIKKNFNDIIICASSSIDEKTIQALRPFEKRGYVDFDKTFLSDYCANCYNLNPLDAFHDAQNRMEEELKQSIIKKHNAEAVGSVVMKIQYEKKNFRHLLLPIYVCSINYKNKLYNQYINGHSGKLVGKKPLSKLKIALAAILGTAAVCATMWLLNRFAIK